MGTDTVIELVAEGFVLMTTLVGATWHLRTYIDDKTKTMISRVEYHKDWELIHEQLKRIDEKLDRLMMPK